MAGSELGDFLRARRAALLPADLEVDAGHRRVPGLRRAEVAARAGVNVDYYARLEQGRERNPSLQVLDALARALLLDPDARRHLRRLADPAGDDPSSVAVDVDAGLVDLVDGWPMHPALVLTGALDVLAANDLARALHRGFATASNLVEMVFDDPAGRQFYRDWDDVAADTVANLRIGWGHAESRERADEVVRALSSTSPDFAVRWERNDVRQKTRAVKRLRHPEVGDLTLHYETFRVEGSGDRFLLVYRAARDSASERALRLLGAPAATAEV